MKVELVKVKINKLKEVKKQLRKKKCSTKKNLKNLLLDNEENKHEDNILYQSITALFEDDENNNEPINSSRNPDSVMSDYHIDLEDLLDSLGAYQNNFLEEGPSESLPVLDSNICTERREECINLTFDNESRNSFSFVNEDNNSNGEHQGDHLYLCDNIETKSLFFFNSSTENLESNTNISSTQLEPDMADLRTYYIPDTICENINDPTIMVDDFCNEIEISITDELNKDNENENENDEQIELTDEVDDPVMPNVNNAQLEGEKNNHTENDVTSNAVRGVAIINPLLVSIPEDDLQTMALYQLQQKNDSQEINNLGPTEILKNYSWEQQANIIAAAKMLYTKRTRTLLHWLDPKLTLPKLRATLELSWQNLPLWQKEVYISQVMGPLAVEATPMLNPQLETVDFKTPAPPEKPQIERKRFADFIADL